MAAITVQFEIGPDSRALIERVAGKVILEIELGPKTRELIDELARTRESEARRAGVESAGAGG